MPRSAFMRAIVSYSASPRNPSARVRPWITSMAMPHSSAIRAISGAFLCSRSHPVRILSVTGISTAARTASRISAVKHSFFMSALPQSVFKTFLAGHPILMSTTSAPSSSAAFAASAITTGSAPRSCTTCSPGSSRSTQRVKLLARQRRSSRLAVISATA